jgi:uncharacterized protein YyaL (SSP411 family)
MRNRLEHETSPYLQQHANNPVAWQPWDEEALAAARKLDKPILLSVGYSACHWCHVMAHESFEDPATAAVMNDLYINIKVDREERPDIDRIYQAAQQLFTGRPGGWPLTAFLTPSQLPIFVGTYFPQRQNHGLPAFTDVLARIEAYFRDKRDEVDKNGEAVRLALKQSFAAQPDNKDAWTRQPIERARERLGEVFDADNGGFGDAPKFPQASSLDLLARCWRGSRQTDSEDVAAGRMLTQTLTTMALGGLYDQVGGGFFRYCVDRHWRIPHFEKMLYDNAALLATYSDAWRETRNPLFARIAGETADWVLRDMRAADGSFYSTLVADSEGVEGKFYTFTPADFERLLEAEQAQLAMAAFGLMQPANFEGEAWHLVLDPASHDETRYARLNPVREHLLRARAERVPPGRDDKRLTAWNGLMIRGLARAARELKRPDLTAAASQAADFVAAELWRDGRLFATYQSGRARLGAYLDDYAFMAQGLLELLQTDFRLRDLEFAVQLAEVMLAHFADPEGGFFFTADDHESLLVRPKHLPDEATPAGNSIAAAVLDDLGQLLGEPRYLAAAESALRAALAAVARQPEAWR